MSFNPQEPYNSIPLLPPDFNFDQVEILKLLNKANNALTKLSVLASKLPNAELLVHPLLIGESVASSGIENINTTVREAFEAEILPQEKRVGPAKEVLHYKDALLFGLEQVKRRGFISTNDIIEMQKMIEPGHQGIRRLDAVIQNSTTKEVIFTPPTGESALRDLLKNLEEYMNVHEDDVDHILKSVIVHYQFECIHPFTDGNGRVGRILMLLYLIMKGKLEYPVLFLSKYIFTHRNDYYVNLRATTTTNDFTELLLYFLEAIEKESLVTIEVVESIIQLIEKTKKITEEHFASFRPGLLDCIFSRALLTIDYVQDYLKLQARQTAAGYLSKLTELGVLKSKKIGRQKVFYNEDFILLLS